MHNVTVSGNAGGKSSHNLTKGHNKMNPHDIHHAIAKEPALSVKVLDAATLVACVIMGFLIYIVY